MKRWTEGHIHIAMRAALSAQGWLLVAGEFPGGSDHELYALNVVDPSLARDDSPDPRHHSVGELIPDLVALRDRDLFIGEAKVRYDDEDRLKLQRLVTDRREHLLSALRKFATEHRIPSLLPVETLILRPALVFLAGGPAPPPPAATLSYLRIVSPSEAYFEGPLSGVPA